MASARDSRVLRTIHLLITICVLSIHAYDKYSGGTAATGTYFFGLIDDIHIYGP
jgi:hypothetical protein